MVVKIRRCDTALLVLDRKSCQGEDDPVPTDVAVLEEPAVAAVALDPTRASMLDHLAAEPASAAALAAQLGVGRQKANYHLQLLESVGLVEEAGRRRHGGLVERLLRPAAGGLVVSPGVFGRAAARPEGVRDRLSAAYAIATAARVVRELGRMVGDADRAGKRLPTLTVDADIRFRTAADRAAFAEDAAAAVRTLAARYHDERTRGGRWYRVTLLAHPRPAAEATDGGDR
jgi:DNA-binding transcriptional ArsR family regulator